MERAGRSHRGGSHIEGRRKGGIMTDREKRECHGEKGGRRVIEGRGGHTQRGGGVRVT